MRLIDGSCAECAYWIPDAILRGGLRFSEQVHGECRRICHTPEVAIPLPGSALVDVDYAVTGVSGRLVTNADFGCVQWARKSTAA